MGVDSHSPPPNKRRRLPGACDTCKTRKVRCDSGQMPGNRCTNCIVANIKCTHEKITSNFKSAKGYAENLEIRLEKMENLLKKLVPGINLNTEDVDNIALDQVQDIPLARNDNDEGFARSTDSNTLVIQGKSSGFHLIKTALNHAHATATVAKAKAHLVKTRRTHYWETPHWCNDLLSSTPQAPYVFPDADLLHSLVELYFKSFNPFLPLLHRGTFLNGLEDGLHLRDRRFGGVVLLVCAVGARWSTDPRVNLQSESKLTSAGWMWFVQVSRMVSFDCRACFSDTMLYELQICALSTYYKVLSFPAGYSLWFDIGAGLRLAQDIGAHRRRPSDYPTSKNELWKRAFFVILTIDRTLGVFRGRPTSMLDEEYDVDYPLQCDDEYWDLPDPESSFKQPFEKPSLITYFVYYLKLMDILAYAMRTLYSCKGSSWVCSRRITRPVQDIIAELDSVLNQWLDSLPPHLRWDPLQNDMLFLHQSALLYVTYQYLRIIIHKPFIPVPHVPSSVNFPSLAICTNAARTSARVVEVMNRLPSQSLIPNMTFPIFSAAVILLLSGWNKLRSGVNDETDWAYVQTCMDFLGSLEHASSNAGRLWDIISGLRTAGQTYFDQSTSSSISNSASEVTEPMFADPNNTSSTAIAESAVRSSIPGSSDIISNDPVAWTNNGTKERVDAEVPGWPLEGTYNFDTNSTTPEGFDYEDWTAFLTNFTQEWSFVSDIQNTVYY